MVSISVEPSFEKGLRALPPHRKKQAINSLALFSNQPDLPRLRFRALQGFSNYFIISANKGDRIILRKDGEAIYAAVDVGPHDNVYRRFDRR